MPLLADFLSEPFGSEPEALEPPEAREQEQADPRKPGRMFARGLGGAHRLSELPYFGAAQALVARRANEAAHALRGICLDLPRRRPKMTWSIDIVWVATPSPPVVAPPRLPAPVFALLPQRYRRGSANIAAQAVKSARVPVR